MKDHYLPWYEGSQGPWVVEIHWHKELEVYFIHINRLGKLEFHVELKVPGLSPFIIGRISWSGGSGDQKNRLNLHVVVMGLSQKLLTRVGFGFGKFPLKISNFSILFPLGQKNLLGLGQKVPGPIQVGLLFTAGQKLCSGRVRTHL